MLSLPKTDVRVLSIPQNPPGIQRLTRVVHDSTFEGKRHSMILDNGSAPLVLDSQLCLLPQTNQDMPPVHFSYGSVKIDPNKIRVGTNKVPVLGEREGHLKALCVEGLRGSVGADGVVGLAKAGNDCLAPADGVCGLREREVALMNQRGFSGFSYARGLAADSVFNKLSRLENLGHTRHMPPIKAYVNAKGRKTFGALKDEPKIVYTSVRRPEGKTFNYSIFQLGWPPEYNALLGKSQNPPKASWPCAYGAQFFGADEIERLDVDFGGGNNDRLPTVGYQLAPGVKRGRCP